MTRGIRRSGVRAGILAGCLLIATACGSAIDESVPEGLARSSLARLEGELRLPGLQGEVEVLRDANGVPHIRAEALEDLFFAQGFVTAQDRLWQMEMRRRTEEGRLAEILGPDALPHDRRQRLLRYRGPFDEAEFEAYHPAGRAIFDAYAAGVNAFISEAGDRLPVEFRLTGVVPEPWTAEQLVGRGGIERVAREAHGELTLAREIAEKGLAAVRRENPTVPAVPLAIPAGMDPGRIDPAALSALEGALPAGLRPPLLPQYASWEEDGAGEGTAGTVEGSESVPSEGAGASGAGDEVGEGNVVGAGELGVGEFGAGAFAGGSGWAVRPSMTAAGATLVVDDVHASPSNPAPLHMVHLEAPGWSAIGAVEPGRPGVTHGHNGGVAWSRTPLAADIADVLLFRLDPADPDRILVDGASVPIRREREEIPLLGSDPVPVELLFGPDGPIFHIDEAEGLAYLLRSPLAERGTADHLGALRLNHATTAEECAATAPALRFPPTTLICGDAQGSITLRIAGRFPARIGWDGRLPAPSDRGDRWAPAPRTDLPEIVDPKGGYLVVADNDPQPAGWTPPFLLSPAGERHRRHERLDALFRGRGEGLTVSDMAVILNDGFNTEWAELYTLFGGWRAEDADLEWARSRLGGWNGAMDRTSLPAALFIGWRASVNPADFPQWGGGGARTGTGAVPGATSVGSEGPDAATRARIEEGLAGALRWLEGRLGPDREEWRWGRLNRSLFPHSVLGAHDLPVTERHGGAGTVDALDGVYQLITDFSDLDRSRFILAPGVSGQPGSPFHANLLEPWANNELLPLPFTRPAIEAAASHRLLLRPAPRP